MMKTKLDSWCEAVIEAGWLAALVVAPMFFNVFSSRVFEPDKISLIRSIALVMVVAWVIKIANGGYFWQPAYQDTSTDNSVVTQLRGAWRNPFVIPILLLILAYLLSTSFSLARFVSWFGSYQRLQGTYSFLSYVTIAILAAAHLRRPEQLRRLQHAIIITSLPIAIYGVIQHYNNDPLPWGGDVTTRVAANAGNAIFLAAYLIMAFFFTIERVYNSFALLLGAYPREAQEDQEMSVAFSGGAYLFITMVQLLAIFWTQSRGPWLGLFLGSYLFVLLVLTAVRPRYYRQLTLAWVGVGVLGILLLALMNTTAMFDFLRPIPYVGRFTQLLNQESNTAQVRILIWEGASNMVRPHEPITFPDGSKDAVNFLRPLVGYGPEAMWVAYNPFYPPALAQVEARNASPDRSHNETWDSLVITGILGFVAYMSLFIAIFYWSLRWLGLLVNRRDNWLFGLLLGGFSLAAILYFLITDGSWRFFGVALPAGIIAGLFFYVTAAAFLHHDLKLDLRDIPRQLLIITIMATVAAHFVEIHFGIAIAATRTYFWVQTATLLVLGMRWAQPVAFSAAQTLAAELEEKNEEEEKPVDLKESRSGRKGRKVTTMKVSAPRRERTPLTTAAALPATVMTDALIFLTFVFIYTTNSTQQRSAFDVLFSSVTQRPIGGALVSSPYIFFLMFFTWLLSATVGLTVEALAQRKAPPLQWWLRGYGLHAAVVWGSWLLYGLIQGARLIPGAAGTNLDEQLSHVAGHFAFYTGLVVFWLLLAGTVYAWPRLSERLAAVRRPALSLVAGVAMAIFGFFVISTVNVALVRADIIYKQGQQFDNQANWVSSIELYRRALAARKTEDHYMLFLGRALLEQAKDVSDPGTYALGENPTIDDVLALIPERVAQMGRSELLRAAEVVLREAQRINPLNTDHTANLARLYRTWSDLTSDTAVRQQKLDESIGEYNMAVTLSPNAAHLWNEKGNAHLARGEDADAEAAYRHSLTLDPYFEQTYLLLADFYDRRQRYQEGVDLLKEGIATWLASQRFNPTAQMYSFLGVACARVNDLACAIDANLEVLKRQPNNVGAMRNLALLYRDQGETASALEWLEKAIALLQPEQVDDIRQLRTLAAQLYQDAGQIDAAIAQYEAIRQVAPQDLETLRTLSNLYNTEQDDRMVVEIAQALMALEPTNYQHPLNIAQALQRAGQTDNARQFGEQALQLAPAEQKPAIQQFLDGLGTSQ
ncbi:MAG: tetratricopeptide repeat protein [Caldilineaceae bacterium]|nr:tetratricopeptide repeat protein [Caldilineaceae bacterium]